MKNSYKGKTLMITGGTGSFGNEMLRYFLNNIESNSFMIVLAAKINLLNVFFSKKELFIYP